MDELTEKVMSKLDVLVTATRMLEHGTLDKDAFERTYDDVAKDVLKMIIAVGRPSWTYRSTPDDQTVKSSVDDYSESKERWIAR